MFSGAAGELITAAAGWGGVSGMFGWGTVKAVGQWQPAAIEGKKLYMGGGQSAPHPASPACATSMCFWLQQSLLPGRGRLRILPLPEGLSG